MRIERTALRRRQRLQRIESGKNQLANGVVTAGQNAFRLAASNQIERVADCIRAGSASVGDDRNRTLKRKRFEEIQRLLLCLIMDDASGLAGVMMRSLDGLAIIGFAQTHSAARCSKNHGKIFGRFPTGLLPRFMRGEEEKFCGAFHSVDTARMQFRSGKNFRKVRLRGDFHPLTGNIKTRDWPDRNASSAKTFRVGFPSLPESRDDSRAGDDDSGWILRMMKWKQHSASF